MSPAAITVLDHADTVAAALSPIRRRMLDLLEQPHSATSLALTLGLARQKVNYHLRELERLGLVHLVDERPRRGLTERFFQVVADRFLIDPELLGASRAHPVPDAFAAERLAATAARAVHDIGELIQAAAARDQRVATFTVEADVTFATPNDLRDFVSEIAELMAKYDRPDAVGGRRHRLIALSHPSLQEDASD